MSSPQYPRDILPQKGWDACIEASTVLKVQQNAIIGHLLEAPKEVCIDTSMGEDMASIYLKYLPVNSMPNLSCSMMGTAFKIVCFHFLPDNEGKKPWSGDESIGGDMLKEENYRYVSEITVIGWELGNVHCRVLPYPRVFPKKSDYDKFADSANTVLVNRKLEAMYVTTWEELMTDPNNANYRLLDVRGEARVNHAPTKLNYWHFTIDLYAADNDKKPLKNINGAWRENMATNLCDYLRRHFVVLENEEMIPRIADIAI